MGKSGKKKKARADQPDGVGTSAVAQATPPGAHPAPEPRRPFWAKPLFWLGGIIVAALGVALTNLLVAQFGEALEVVTETGPPLSVDLVGVSEMSGGTVAVPSDVAVSAADIDSLNTMPIEERPKWFRAREAAHPSALLLDLVVSGTRSDPVRIMDITPVRTCSPADAGTLFLDPPAGGGDESIWLRFDLDSPRPVAIQRADDGSADAPFFPNFTVPLKKNEQQVFTIELSTEEGTCAVELELSVLDGDELVTQRVTAEDGDPFRVTASLPRTAWKQVYLGGVASCEGGLFHPASEAWLREDLDPCGLG